MTSSSSIRGGFRRRSRDHPPLGQQQGQERRAAAGPESRRPAARDRHAPDARSSRWGPWPVKPRSRSDPRPVGELRRQRIDIHGPRPRPVVEGGAAVEPERRAGSPEGLGQSRHRLPAIRHECDPVPGQLLVPGGQRLRAPLTGANPGDEGVALGQGLRIGPASGDSRRPQGGHELVQVRPAQGRRALDELQAVGQKHAHQRPLARRRPSAPRRPRRRASAWARRGRTPPRARAARPRPPRPPRPAWPPARSGPPRARS